LIIFKTKLSVVKWIFSAVLWLTGQGVWLYFAYLLEFKGENTFFELWIASLAFFAINCIIIKSVFIDNYQFTPLKEQSTVSMDDKKETQLKQKEIMNEEKNQKKSPIKNRKKNQNSKTH
jgi:hypothetical protein